MAFSSEYLQTLRADCPAASRFIHLNNAGASLMPGPVLDAMLHHLKLEADQGGYEAADQRAGAIRDFYRLLAALFGGRPDQYAFCTSATDAFNKALSSIPIHEGDTWLTTRHDYASNQIALLQAARRFGTELRVARDLKEGGVDLADLERLIRLHRPTLVVVTQVPSHTGLIQPVADIGRLCREYDIWYLVDGCQAAGQLALHLPDLQCDFFSATFRKFLRGPRGAGFLYLSDRVLDSGLAPLFLDLHSAGWTAPEQYQPQPDARRFELWERSYAVLLGARASLEYALSVDMPAAEKRIKTLAGQLRAWIGELPGWRVLDRGSQLSGIVAARPEGAQPDIMHRLRDAGIHTSIAYGRYAQYTMAQQQEDWALRLSPHYYNTAEEIIRTIDWLRRLGAS